MKVARNSDAEKALMQRIRDERYARSPGLHQSDLTYCARKAWVRLNRDDLFESGEVLSETDDSTLIFFLGEGHHQILGGTTSNAKSIVFNGVSYTVDELMDNERHMGENRPVIVEYKTTRSSSNVIVGKTKSEKTNREINLYGEKPVTAHENYLDQLGSYCAAHNIPYGRLHIFYLLGGYNPPFPVHRCWDIEFSEEELAGRRRELARRKHLIETAQSMYDIPVEEHYGWECDYCDLAKQGVCEGSKENAGRRGDFLYVEGLENPV